MSTFAENFLISMSGSLAGAFVGAGTAFLLEAIRRRAATKTRNIASTNSTLFTLGNLYNELLQYKRDIVEPMKNTGSSFLMPTPPWPANRPTIDMNAMTFLVDIGSSETLGVLSQEQSNTNQLFSAIEQYSHAHVYELQPKMAANKIANGQQLNANQAMSVAGPNLYARLKGLNDYIINDIDKTIRSLDDTMIAVRNSVHKLDRKAKLLEFRIQNTTSN